MRRLLTTTLALACIALPSNSAESLNRNKGEQTPGQRILVASALVTSTTSARGFNSTVVVEPKKESKAWPLSTVPVLLHDANSKDNRIFLISRDGHVVGDDMSALDDFFRCRRSQRRHRMAPEILQILADISSAYPGHVIEVVSGYRKRGFGVKKSKHFSGHAIDLRVRGVKTAELRDFLWAGQDAERGVGHYRHENFVHVDHRSNEAKVGWTQRRRNSSYQFNPKWARADEAATPAKTRVARL